jgi:AcrR family transcriptional regulator
MLERQAARSTNRLKPLLDAGAREFANQGYSGTTTRAIAAAASMTPGAIYVHFPSKQALLLAVYGEGVRRATEAVDEAIARPADPWTRLEAAIAAHLRVVLDQSDYARVMTQVRPEHVDGVAGELRIMRERYEERFRALVADLGLPDAIDERLFRLLLLGALNWSPVWYKPGHATVEELAAAFVVMLNPARAAKRPSPPATDLEAIRTAKPDSRASTRFRA